MVYTSNIYTYPIMQQPTLTYIDNNIHIFSLFFITGTMFLSALSLYTYIYLNK